MNKPEPVPAAECLLTEYTVQSLVPVTGVLMASSAEDATYRFLRHRFSIDEPGDLKCWATGMPEITSIVESEKGT